MCGVSRVSVVGCRLWVVGCRLWVVGLVSNFLMGLSELEMLWSYCFRFSVVGCGFSVVGSRLWVLGCGFSVFTVTVLEFGY
jgi:hypothetical protein